MGVHHGLAVVEGSLDGVRAALAARGLVLEVGPPEASLDDLVVELDDEGVVVGEVGGFVAVLNLGGLSSDWSLLAALSRDVDGLVAAWTAETTVGWVELAAYRRGGLVRAFAHDGGRTLVDLGVRLASEPASPLTDPFDGPDAALEALGVPIRGWHAGGPFRAGTLVLVEEVEVPRDPAEDARDAAAPARAPTASGSTRAVVGLALGLLVAAGLVAWLVRG